MLKSEALMCLPRWNARIARGLGFTLAEVLVTLAIIGVVSAMTVPTLMQNHQRKTYVTQLHKVYNEFSQALIQYQNDKNAVNLTEAGFYDINNIDAFMKKYFKIVQDCGSDCHDCFADKYKKLDGSSNINPVSLPNAKGYILADGASICINTAQMHIDINGKQGPNIAARDLFAVKIYNNGTIDENCTNTPCTTDERENSFNNNCAKDTGGNYWWGCFGKILNDNWEMTY